MNPPYQPSLLDVDRLVEAFDAFNVAELRRVLSSICTRVYSEGYLAGHTAQGVPDGIKEVLLNATGAYEALRLGLGEKAVAIFLPGAAHCEERLKAVLAGLGVADRA